MNFLQDIKNKLNNVIIALEEYDITDLTWAELKLFTDIDTQIKLLNKLRKSRE